MTHQTDALHYKLGGSDWYALDAEHNVVGPIEMDDPLFRESRRFENRRVAKTVVFPGCEVSTVFLGLDHGWTDGPPVVFETMVFGGPFSDHQERYCTWDEAVKGHARIVEMCQPIMTEELP